MCVDGFCEERALCVPLKKGSVAYKDNGRHRCSLLISMRQVS